ncbi:MAG: 2,3-bisphosphoglycerate-independent phosphoglycerate mutase, partial [Terriglobales bacterium]
MSGTHPPKPLVLVILDGWGNAPPGPGNAISLAHKPVYDRLLQTFPHSVIHTSGPFVGLPEGQMGNSEVGHLNLGAGRIVKMDITRLDETIADGSFARNPALLAAMQHARRRQLHLVGLCSDGGVHAHLDHLYALLRLAKEQGVEHVWVHAITDGRDTPPHSGRGYLEQLEQKMREYGIGAIATVSGRYYAMDRDQRWARMRQALEVMTHAAGERAASATAALTASYEHDRTDEFVVPTVIGDYAGMHDEDAVICFNFRADRARQITRALTRTGGATPALEDAIPAGEVPRRLHYVCMTRYDRTFTLPVVLPPVALDHILAQVLAERGLRNLRVAETEKYAHV